MAQINLELITLAKKQVGSDKRAGTIGLRKGKFPVGVNFVCPYCNYIGKKNKTGSARIYDKQFVCFHCGERRKIDGIA